MWDVNKLKISSSLFLEEEKKVGINWNWIEGLRESAVGGRRFMFAVWEDFSLENNKVSFRVH